MPQASVQLLAVDVYKRQAQGISAVFSFLIFLHRMRQYKPLLLVALLLPSSLLYTSCRLQALIS